MASVPESSSRILEEPERLYRELQARADPERVQRTMD